MFESLKAFFTQHAAPAGAGTPAETAARRLHVAACALLLEMAHSDDEFADSERHHIEQILVQHFRTDPSQVQGLIAAAESQRQHATDLYQFTSLIVEHYDEGQRLLIAELLWRVVMADGKLSEHEDYLMQKLSHLLDLRPGYLAEAKKRAAPR